MSPKSREDFIADSGGFLDGVNGDIIEARFELAKGKYADKVLAGGSDAKIPVVITIVVATPEMDKPFEQSYSVGGSDAWEIVDNGGAIVNKNPDKHSFRKGSMAWHLVEAMMKAVGDGDIDKGQEFFVQRDFYMTEAAFFTGLSWYWESTTIKTDFKDRTVESNPPLPVKYLGKAAGGSSSTASSASSVADDELDTILIENATGKTDKEVKSFAVRNDQIKKNDVYMKSVVSGKKLKELEDAGKLIKDPDTGLYL
jgi:hypothetical protein